MGDLPLRTPTHRRLGGPLHRQLANGTHAHLEPNCFFPNSLMRGSFVRGINLPFGRLFPCSSQVAYALRTRAPVVSISIATNLLPLDLHVLSLPLAFILSQDQTLHCIISLFLLLSFDGFPYSWSVISSNITSATLVHLLSKI